MAARQVLHRIPIPGPEETVLRNMWTEIFKLRHLPRPPLPPSPPVGLLLIDEGGSGFTEPRLGPILQVTEEELDALHRLNNPGTQRRREWSCASCCCLPLVFSPEPLGLNPYVSIALVALAAGNLFDLLRRWWELRAEDSEDGGGRGALALGVQRGRGLPDALEGLFGGTPAALVRRGVVLGLVPNSLRAAEAESPIAGAASSLPVSATRSSDAERKAMVGAVRTARRAAMGALWAAKSERGRGRGFGDVERMLAVVLGVRLARSVRVREDDSPKEYRKSGFLSSYPEKKRVGIDPVKHQASVPEWKDKPSDKETEVYRAQSLPKLGTIVCPNKDVSANDEPERTRKERVDSCTCSHPGSEDCVRVHVKKARSWIKEQLGEEAFKNCGLDVMGEQVGELWTAVDKKKLEDVDKSIPQNKHQIFMKIALKELSQKETKDLAKYYYNVFLPRRLASWTRAEHKEDEAFDTDDEKSSQDDDNNEHHPRKKSKSSGSSSTRSRK